MEIVSKQTKNFHQTALKKYTTDMTDPASSLGTRWHLFCRVIDNYGDIGVSWRLATELQACGALVVLIVDDWTAWRTLVGNTPTKNITIISWQEPLPAPAECVVEAFGCALPDAYRAQMPTRTRHWFILDYFSAELWVPGYHGCTSPQANGLTARFIYPSILPETGGLLGEAWIESEQLDFAATANTWRARWRIPEPQGEAIFLFGYEQAAIKSLIYDWAGQTQTKTLYFAAGRLLADTRRQLGFTLPEGEVEVFGTLRLTALPFIPQREFDRLLWGNTINIVRGEDSLTRALWAGKPFIWHIYPTDDGAHWAKLDALLTAAGDGLDAGSFDAWRQVNLDWNAQTYHPNHWRAFEAAEPILRAHFAALPERLRRLPDLADTLVKHSEE